MENNKGGGFSMLRLVCYRREEALAYQEFSTPWLLSYIEHWDEVSIMAQEGVSNASDAV